MSAVDVTRTDDRPESDEAAAAFDAMRRQLALLASAAEGFASHQQAIATRDYGPDLEKIAARMTDKPTVEIDAQVSGRRLGTVAAAEVDYDWYGPRGVQSG